MRTSSRYACCRLLGKTLLMFMGLLVLAAGSVLALDVEDVKNLIRNHVPEQVIINMVRSDGTIYITPEEADEFRDTGVSENLIVELRPRSHSADPVVVASSPPVVTQVVQPQTVTSAMPVDGTPISPVAIATSSAYPPRCEKEGWLSISNRDWTPYYVNVTGDKRMFVSKSPNGGVVVQSGENVVLNLRKETYKMYGDSGRELKVRIRDGETTNLSFNPFGVFGNSGLTGVATDRDRVRSETLFNNYAPPPATVVVQEPPVIVVPGPRPPVHYYYYGRPYRHYRGGSGAYFRYSW